MDRKVYKMTAIFKFDCEYEYEYQYENRFLFVDVYPNYFKDGKWGKRKIPNTHRIPDAFGQNKKGLDIYLEVKIYIRKHNDITQILDTQLKIKNHQKRLNRPFKYALIVPSPLLKENLMRLLTKNNIDVLIVNEKQNDLMGYGENEKDI